MEVSTLQFVWRFGVQRCQTSFLTHQSRRGYCSSAFSPLNQKLIRLKDSHSSWRSTHDAGISKIYQSPPKTWPLLDWERANEAFMWIKWWNIESTVSFKAGLRDKKKKSFFHSYMKAFLLDCFSASVGATCASLEGQKGERASANQRFIPV